VSKYLTEQLKGERIYVAHGFSPFLQESVVNRVTYIMATGRRETHTHTERERERERGERREENKNE
jgi:hypothetical protein